MDNLESLMARLDVLESRMALARRALVAGAATRSILVQVYRESVVPTATDKYFATRRVVPAWDDAEGAAVDVDGPEPGTPETIVGVIGGRVPVAGDLLIANTIGSRWVAEEPGRAVARTVLCVAWKACGASNVPGITITIYDTAGAVILTFTTGLDAYGHPTPPSPQCIRVDVGNHRITGTKAGYPGYDHITFIGNTIFINVDVGSPSPTTAQGCCPDTNEVVAIPYGTPLYVTLGRTSGPGCDLGTQPYTADQTDTCRWAVLFEGLSGPGGGGISYIGNNTWKFVKTDFGSQSGGAACTAYAIGPPSLPVALTFPGWSSASEYVPNFGIIPLDHCPYDDGVVGPGAGIADCGGASATGVIFPMTVSS